MWPLLVRREDSDLSYEDIASETSFGYLALKAEGAPITYDLPIQGSTKRYTNAVYALGFSMTYEDQYFGRWRKMADYARALGESARETKEVNIWTELITGDTTSTIANGEYIFETTHAIPRGGSQSNYVASALAYSSLQTALGNISAMKDPRGFPAHLRPKYLWVHPTQYLLACEILKSVGRPDVMDRADNQLMGMLVPMRTPYITTAADWFIECEKHSFFMFQHMPFVVDYWWDGETKNWLVSVQEGYSYGFQSYIGYYMGTA